MRPALVRVARVELTRMRRSGALAALAVVLGGLIVASGLVAWRAERAYEAQRQRYSATVDAQWDQQPDRHPHRVSHYGYLLFRPRAPLGFFDAGVTANTGSTLFIEAHRQNSMNFGDAAHADAPLRFGGLSMALVLQLLIPLVIFIAAAGSVAREREEGTLALVRSLGTSWAAWLGGKVLALVVAALAIVLPGTLVVAAVLAATRDVAWTSDAWARTGALALAHVAYFAVCALIGVLVSAVSRTSRDATLALVGLWLALWVIVPRVVPAIGAAADQLPTRAAFEAEVERRTRALGDSHNPNDPTFAAFKAETLAKAGVSRVEDLPVNYNGILMIEGERLTTDAYRGMRALLDDSRRGHERSATIAAAVSPFLAMRLASMALAGVDVRHVDDFERQAEDYRYTLVQHLNQLHAEEVAHADDRYVSTGGGSDAPSRKRIEAEHWQDTPAFAYAAPVFGTAAAQAAAALAVLGLWLGGMTVWLWRVRPGVA
jgi:ABC-2 type transport system permease protein